MFLSILSTGVLFSTQNILHLYYTYIYIYNILTNFHTTDDISYDNFPNILIFNITRLNSSYQLQKSLNLFIE